MRNATIDIIDDLQLLVAEASAPNVGLHKTDSPGQQVLAMLASELRELRIRCARDPKAYKVAVVGLGNVGKSTLVNALLGQPVAPVRNGPCTASVVEFRHGPALKLEARGDALLAEEFRFSAVGDLQGRLTAMVDHASAESRAWTRLIVSLPAAILENGLIIADTPGFGAAGDVGEDDDRVLTEFLKKDVAQIFWVVMADEGIPLQAHRLYEQFLRERCDDLIVTNAEDWSDDDRSRWRKRYAPYLRRMPNMHFVSGKIAREARSTADIAKWEASGMKVVENRIRELASAPDRVEAVTKSLESLGGAVIERLADLEGRHGSGRLFLPTGAARFLTRHASQTWLPAWQPLLRRSLVTNF